MTPVKREELPELPEGWRFIESKKSLYSFQLSDRWVARDNEFEVTVIDGDLVTGSVYGNYDCRVSVAVVAAVLFANGVTLPEVPGRSSLLGGK